MKSRDLILNAAKRKSSGGALPLQFAFADSATEKNFADYMGMSQAELSAWLDNDLKTAYPIEDSEFVPLTGGDIDLAKKFGFAKDSPMEGAFVDFYGCTWAMNCIGQELKKGSIKDVEEVYTFPYPPADHPESLHGLDAWVKNWENAGYATVIFQEHNMFERAWAMMGYEEFLVACYTDPEAVEYFLDRLTERKVIMAERICALRPSVGHTGDDFGIQSGGVMSPEMFRRFFKPRYEKIWSVYKKHGIPVLHHSCGDCSLYLEDMIEIGLTMVNPVQQNAMDIRELSRRFGDSLTFFASIDAVDTLINGKPDDVRRNVDETVEILGRNNGLILSMLNVMPETPPENVKTAIEQMMQYRKR